MVLIVNGVVGLVVCFKFLELKGVLDWFVGILEVVFILELLVEGVFGVEILLVNNWWFLVIEFCF